MRRHMFVEYVDDGIAGLTCLTAEIVKDGEDFKARTNLKTLVGHKLVVVNAEGGVCWIDGVMMNCPVKIP